jgi:hypothetical protein
MALLYANSNVIAGEKLDSINTLPITDSTTITERDFVEISGGKVIKSVTTLSSNLVGIANTTQTMGVLATTGTQVYAGVITEGLVKVRGLVEGSGGTYTTAIAIGSKVSFHYSASAGYGQFVVASTAAPIGTVVYGSVAASGTTDDNYDYVLVELDFEPIGSSSGVADGSITTAKLGNGSVTGTKIATGGISSSVYLATGVVTATKTGADVPGINFAAKMWVDMGTFAISATESTALVAWTSSITSTTGVRVYLQALTKTGTIPIPSTMTATNFTVTGTASQTGNWMCWIPNGSHI